MRSSSLCSKLKYPLNTRCAFLRLLEPDSHPPIIPFYRNLGGNCAGEARALRATRSQCCLMLDQAAEMLPWFPRNATYHMELLASSVKGRDNLLQLIIPIMSRKADSINRTKPTSAMRVLL